MNMQLNYEITQLLAEESLCLDRREFRRWLDFYTDDALYWVKGWSDDPNAGIAVIYDDKERMGERVFRLLDTSAYAQMPPSKTIHVNGPVSNVVEDGETITAETSVIIAEIRPGDLSQVGLAEPRAVYARVSVEFRRGEDGGLLIRKKIIDLLDREQPLYNLTFIL